MIGKQSTTVSTVSLYIGGNSERLFRKQSSSRETVAQSILVTTLASRALFPASHSAGLQGLLNAIIDLQRTKKSGNSRETVGKQWTKIVTPRKICPMTRFTHTKRGQLACRTQMAPIMVRIFIKVFIGPPLGLGQH